jgi:hypothetical protein
MSTEATAPPQTATRTSHLLNRSEVRKFILDTMQRHRPHLGITRVSQEALEKLEYWLREKIRGEVHRHPSLGKTFKL